MLKNLTLLALSCFLIVFTNSCTKESDIPGTDPGGTSIFNFGGSPGGCTAPVVKGYYVIGKQMDASNTLTLNVTVVKKGTYSFSTTGANGIWFFTTGIFTTTGPQTIVMTAKGTPVKAGNFIFAPATNTTCNFSVTFLASAPPAVFTYAGATGACTAPSINGTYGVGSALTAANYVDLSVNVTSPGVYSVSTNSANGIIFSASGSFTTTGPGQTIRLLGSGTPASTGSNTYTPTGGCSFPINVTTAGGTSIYTLDCSAPVVSGSYTTGVPLGAGNTITIKANVTGAGTYSISTPPVNGMTFSASGTFAVGTGQNIVLTGSGTPLVANTSSIAIGFGGCTVPVTAVAPPPAVYNLTCVGTNVSGIYNVGTPLTSSNKVDVEVNVTSPGAYTITSSTANGMTFSKTGVFTSATIQTVTLTGSGTPGIAGTDNFTVGAASCPFSVTTTTPPPPTSPCTGLTLNKFTIVGQYSINSPAFGADNGMGGFVYIMQEGFINVNITFPGSTPPAPGTYSIGAVTIHSLAADFRDWNAISGTVYVGATTIEFCNVAIRGVSLIPGGGTINSTCEAKF
jgi:hypothetical protein